MLLYCPGVQKFSEKDNWENGCTGEIIYEYINSPVQVNTKEDAIRYCLDFTGEINRDNIEFNSCDEPGRIDIQVQEDDCGNRLTEEQWELFKKGKIDSYLVTYSSYFVEQVEFTF